MAHINTSLDTLALDNTAVYTQALKNTDAACYRNVYTYTHKNTHTIIRVQPAIKCIHIHSQEHTYNCSSAHGRHTLTHAHIHTHAHTHSNTLIYKRAHA